MESAVCDGVAEAGDCGAIKRAKLWMLKRNACIALGNIGTPQELSLLEEMQSLESDMVRIVGFEPRS